MTLVYPVVPQLDESASPADPELITAVRTGDTRAYALLYERHEPAARGLARQLARSPHDVDDLIAEAFAKVFRMLRSGGGPDVAFRAYLLTTLRHVRYERARRDRRLELSDDMARHDQGVPWTDPIEAELDSTLAARAFARLPERWQAVLWYSEVEQESTAQVGQRLGLRPNAVAALAYRAREALREAYLQVHLRDCGEDECRATVERLGGWTRQRLSATDSAQVRTHLAGCASCRRLAAELGEINSGLRGLLAPLLPASFLVTAAAGAASATGTSVATAVSAGGAVGGGAAAAATAVSAAGGAVGGGSVVGSVAAWVFGTHAGQAVAVVTALVVGGTAVAAGGGAPHPGRHRAAAAAVADTRAVTGADRTGGSAVAAPAAATEAEPAAVGPAQSTSAEAGRSTVRSLKVKSGKATSSRGSAAGPGSNRNRSLKGSSKGKSSASSASSGNAAGDGAPESSRSNGSAKNPKDRSATGGPPADAGSRAGSPAAERSAAASSASSPAARSAAASSTRAGSKAAKDA